MNVDIDEMHDLIAAHAAAYARFGRSVTLTDTQVAAKEKRKITEADEAEHEAANAAEIVTFRVILATTVDSVATLRTKIGWLQWRLSLGSDLDADDLDVLLTSLMHTKLGEARHE
jgi:hypothetical protein